MEMEDLGIEAKEAAVREVAKILPLPDLLVSIVSIKADYLSRQRANDAQLSTMVAKQVEQAHKGIDALGLCQKTINQICENFLSIEKLCQECQMLIENHDKIKLLSNARNNLNTTLKDVGGMMSISLEAAVAQDSLRDDKELIHTFERLTALDGKWHFALAAAASHEEEVGRLREYFEDVDRTWETFEKTLWGHISNFFKLAKESDIFYPTFYMIFSCIAVHKHWCELQDWYEGLVTEYLIATFGDYFGDIKMYIEDRSFRRFVESCLEETIVVYVDHLLTQRNYIREETIERMRLDEEVLLDFFREHLSLTKVENRVRILSDLRELASAESLDSFALIYTNILEHQADCPPEVVEKLVALQKGIPRKEAKEVVQECKEIYENSLADGNPPKAGFVLLSRKAHYGGSLVSSKPSQGLFRHLPFPGY